MKELNTLLGMTTSELSRSDAKFRNIGTVNSILISTFVAILIFAIKYEEGTLKWVTLGIAAFFLLTQICSIVICLYGVWPRERYKHSPYDIRFISKRKNINAIQIESFSEKRLKQMIRINATMVIQKRELFKKSLIITLFPISLLILLHIKKQDKNVKAGFDKNEQKYTDMMEKESRDN